MRMLCGGAIHAVWALARGGGAGAKPGGGLPERSLGGRRLVRGPGRQSSKAGPREGGDRKEGFHKSLVLWMLGHGFTPRRPNSKLASLHYVFWLHSIFGSSTSSRWGRICACRNAVSPARGRGGLIRARYGEIGRNLGREARAGCLRGGVGGGCFRFRHGAPRTR